MCFHVFAMVSFKAQCIQFPYLPNRWKYRYLQCFLQFFHVPMPVANSNIYIRNPSKTLFLTVFFPMFPVKQTVIYTFFAIKAVNPSKTLPSSQAYGNLHVFCYNVSPKRLFLQSFQCSGIQNPCKISCYVQCFFHFWPFFHCRKATKMTQNSISIPSCAQTPKNPRKMSKTPPNSGLGAKPVLPPPQLKLI